MIRIMLFIVLYGTAALMPCHAAEYAAAITATPVLNTPDLTSVFGGRSGRQLKTDRCGQVRELEYIALPDTLFRLVGRHRSGTADIYQVESDEYPAPPGGRLYVDGRFLAFGRSAAESRRIALPPLDRILSTLRASAGLRYVWGGNVPEGVPELAQWYFGGGSEGDILAGLDCSGLLYNATRGATPRNTSQLIAFGQGVAVAGRSAAEIAKTLLPLDLIVWNGHVIIVLDRQTAIESRLECGKPGNGGVVLTDLTRRIAEVMRTRRPVNAWPEGKKKSDIFVVRRWYGRP